MQKIGLKKAVLLWCAAAMAVALCVSSCSPGAAWSDRREDNDPLVRRARTKKRAQDIEGAITLYSRAIARKPGLGRAHLEIGLLYDEYNEDYVRAIYHYEKYLELRPDTEKRNMIEELIRRARISYAASLPEKPSGAVELIAELRRENKILKAKLDEASDKKEKRSGRTSSTSSTRRESASVRTSRSARAAGGRASTGKSACPRGRGASGTGRVHAAARAGPGVTRDGDVSRAEGGQPFEYRGEDVQQPERVEEDLRSQPGDLEKPGEHSRRPDVGHTALKQSGVME
jgi:tetratricopeptide (TPR) repeat protein